MPYKNPEDAKLRSKRYYQENKEKIKKQSSDRYYKLHPERPKNIWYDEKISQLLFLKNIGVSYKEMREIFENIHSIQSIRTKYSELCGSKINPLYGKKEVRVCNYCGKKFKCPIVSNYKMCSKECSISNLIDINPMRGKMGKDSRMWKGGKSFEIYPQEFNKSLKEKIRELYQYICQECNYTEEELQETLSIHHIDYNKNNNLLDNLIPLCRSCHAQTNYSREDWTKYFTNKMEV